MKTWSQAVTLANCISRNLFLEMINSQQSQIHTQVTSSIKYLFQSKSIALIIHGGTTVSHVNLVYYHYQDQV